jgi:hypothetical protein
MLLFALVAVVAVATLAVWLWSRFWEWRRAVRGPFRVTQLHYYPVK